MDSGIMSPTEQPLLYGLDNIFEGWLRQVYAMPIDGGSAIGLAAGAAILKKLIYKKHFTYVFNYDYIAFKNVST